MPTGVYKRSEETRKKISKANMGHKVSEKTRRAVSLAHKGKSPWNKGNKSDRKCSLENCNEPHEAAGFCKKHYAQMRRRDDSEFRDRSNLRKRQHRTIVFEKLGSKCHSCGEKFNPKLEVSNLQIHHREYTDEEKILKQKSRHKMYDLMDTELKEWLKHNKISELKKKYALLCEECHRIETFSHQNPKKAFDMFAWMYGEGLFEEVLKDDPKLKKLTEFVK